jgi:small subunit ribosomal protein S16
MAVKIRLAMHGKKGHAFFHIVVADGRAPRDGKMIEKLGTYDPNTNPATIVLNFDRALVWLQNGAQPTDTARAILSYEGVLLRKHLDIGVKKGALTVHEAQQRFDAWLAERNQKIESKKDSIAKKQHGAKQQRIEAESKVRAAKAEVVSAKRRSAADNAAKTKTQTEEPQQNNATAE